MWEAKPGNVEKNVITYFIASQKVIQDSLVGAQVQFSKVQHAFYTSAYQPDFHPVAVVSADCSCSYVNVKQLQRRMRTMTDRTAGAVKNATSA